MMVLPALIVNLPIIRNVIFSQSMSSRPSVIAAQQQATPAQNRVAQKSHFLPTLVIMYMATAMAGISTRPASACKKNRGQTDQKNRSTRMLADRTKSKRHQRCAMPCQNKLTNKFSTEKILWILCCDKCCSLSVILARLYVPSKL